MNGFWRYTLLRFGLLLSCTLISYAVLAIFFSPVKIEHVLISGFLLSLISSWFLLAGPRAEFAQQISERASAAQARFEAAKAKEDEIEPEDKNN